MRFPFGVHPSSIDPVGVFASIADNKYGVKRDFVTGAGGGGSVGPGLVTRVRADVTTRNYRIMRLKRFVSLPRINNRVLEFNLSRFHQNYRGHSLRGNYAGEFVTSSNFSRDNAIFVPSRNSCHPKRTSVMKELNISIFILRSQFILSEFINPTL